MTSVMKTGKPRVRFVVSASRLGRDTIVEQWGCWTAVEPDSGKSETINGVNIYEVEFETCGRRSVSSCRLRPIDFAVASVLERTMQTD